MDNTSAVDHTGSVPTPTNAESASLRGRMGVAELALTVLAFAAPLASVVGVLPLVIIFGGVGAPLAFVAATVVLLLFSVGYTTMSRYLPNPGAFYAYISAGIGKPVGLASSFLAMLGYMMVGLGITLFFGIVAADTVATTLHGPDLPWWSYSILLVLIVGVLGYLRIDLSAKVLSVVMVVEILIVLVFDAAVGAKGGPEGRSLEPFAWSAFSQGQVGVAILFAVITFLGFEATAIFREEAKDPRRTVPRATYLAVACIGAFYILTTWLLIVAYGTTQAADVANANAPAMFTDAMETFVGTWGRDTINILVVTSAFAAVLSCQNIIARYGHSLGIDRALPPALGKVHPRHGSPHISSLVFTTIFFIGVLVFSQTDPAKTYAWLAGAGGFPLLLLMFLTSVAVLVFFHRSRGQIVDTTPWHTTVAPSLAIMGLGAALYLSFTNFTLVTGGDSGIAVTLQVVVWAVFAVGIVTAVFFRAKRPETYARIGRQTLG
ncbi:hypothetical protein BCA37_30160 [Mycobacterium sp. djl-10]|nr:hypothetical protein BCA37_30160 [Mycobacterium sp. djl-10]